MIDPIVQEVRDSRQEYTNKFNEDLEAICADLRSIQKNSGHKLVTLPAVELDRKKEAHGIRFVKLQLGFKFPSSLLLT